MAKSTAAAIEARRAEVDLRPGGRWLIGPGEWSAGPVGAAQAGLVGQHDQLRAVPGVQLGHGPVGVCLDGGREWLMLSPDDRARRRYVLLSHHEDPVTRFEPLLAVQRPAWLALPAARPPGISPLARWYPVTTFILILMDLKNALHVVPGTFAALGHDYRADLAQMVSQVYRLPASDTELAAIEYALRRREAACAQQRLVAEQLHQATEAIRRQTRSQSQSAQAAPNSPVSAARKDG